MDLSSTSRTIQELLHEVQEYVFDFNVHQQSLNLDPDETLTTDMSIFPGLKGYVQPSNEDNTEEKGINELVMLQQRTVLQVKKTKV